MIHGTGKIVVLDFCFCVLQGLTDMNKKGVCECAIVKNRWYWPHYIDGGKIKSHLKKKGVGVVDALSGEIEKVPLHVFAMK